MNRLTQALLRHGHDGYTPDQYFSWLLDDCLAAIGKRIEDIPPEKAREGIFELAELYAKVVQETAPFTDVLGETYQELASNGHKKHLGQYFTPMPVAKMMALMTSGDSIQPDDNRLIRVVDPASGSGVMLLAFADVVAERAGNVEALKHYSFTGIDLDRVCARMAPLQLIANGLYHGAQYGELCFFRGNALGDPADLDVVLHATRSDLPPEAVVPAKHPARVEALREVVKAKSEQLSLFA